MHERRRNHVTGLPKKLDDLHDENIARLGVVCMSKAIDSRLEGLDSRRP